MDYTIREMEAFSVVGQEIELTNFQRMNIKICTQFWLICVIIKWFIV